MSDTVLLRLSLMVMMAFVVLAGVELDRRYTLPQDPPVLAPSPFAQTQTIWSSGVISSDVIQYQTTDETCSNLRSSSSFGGGYVMTWSNTDCAHLKGQVYDSDGGPATSR